MELGRFSLSLAVSDLLRSRDFYEALGFAQVAGEPENNWIILQNGDAKIGLFQGMFDENIMTFNPPSARAIEAAADAAGITLESRTSPGDGPTHLTLRDPDGNLILIDQH